MIPGPLSQQSPTDLGDLVPRLADDGATSEVVVAETLEDLDHDVVLSLEAEPGLSLRPPNDLIDVGQKRRRPKHELRLLEVRGRGRKNLLGQLDPQTLLRRVRLGLHREELKDGEKHIVMSPI